MRFVFALMLLAVFAEGQPPRPIAGRIRIERTQSGARFHPAELVAWAGDQIHWFNDTADVHEPGVLNNDGKFVSLLEDPVAARSASSVFSPMPRIDDKNSQVAFTIHYVCGRHRDEQGVIQVVPTP